MEPLVQVIRVVEDRFERCIAASGRTVLLTSRANNPFNIISTLTSSKERNSCYKSLHIFGIRTYFNVVTPICHVLSTQVAL